MNHWVRFAKKLEEAVMYNPLLRKHPWEKWFAWRPVKINNKWRWLKPVYRRHHAGIWWSDRRSWEYGTIFDVLKDAK